MKRLVVIAQMVNQDDDHRGFFIGWLRAFSKKFESVSVITVGIGDYSLPENVFVYSLGKEKKRNKVFQAILFYWYLIRVIKRSDAIFAHASPIFIVAAWPIALLFNRPLTLWYAHGHVSGLLKVAEKLSSLIFTSTPEGFRLKSTKVRVIGQGIDTDVFKPSYYQNKNLKIVSVGRISPSKDYETLFKALEIIAPTYPDMTIELAGSTSSSQDIEYQKHLSQLLITKGLYDRVTFVGVVPNAHLPEFLNSACIFVNMSHTGSLDKAILEAMACGVPLLTCNEALESVLGPYAPLLMYPKKDHVQLAQKIKAIIEMPPSSIEHLSHDLREIVVKGHNIESLANNIYTILANQ